MQIYLVKHFAKHHYDFIFDINPKKLEWINLDPKYKHMSKPDFECMKIIPAILTSMLQKDLWCLLLPQISRLTVQILTGKIFHLFFTFQKSDYFYEKWWRVIILFHVMHVTSSWSLQKAALFINSRVIIWIFFSNNLRDLAFFGKNCLKNKFYPIENSPTSFSSLFHFSASKIAVPYLKKV